MKIYIASLCAGLLVGVIYGLLHVRSPAPPVVALIGLFGILAGEQIPTVAKGLWAKQPIAQSWVQHIRPHVFGRLPEGQTKRVDAAKAPEPPASKG